MAGVGAVAATSRAVLGLLESAAAAEPAVTSARFFLVGAAGLQNEPSEPLAASLYLYHVGVNASRGGSVSRLDAHGRLRRPPLRLELHYLLTAWSKSPESQQRLLGWCVRVLYDTPTLPAAVLNRSSPGVFRPDESIELVWESVSTQTLYDIWQVAEKNQQPSATYVARIVEIDPTVEPEPLPLVQTVDNRYRTAVLP
jgi:hypothetical protein